MKQKREEITFSEIIAMFAPKAWIIALVAVVFGAIFGMYSMFFKKNTYTSSTEMYVYRNSQTPSSNDLLLAEKMIETYSLFLVSDDALKEVISRVPDDYEQKDKLSIAFVKSATRFISKGNGLFVISVTTSDPILSFYLANSFEVVAVELIKLKVPNALPIELFQSPQTARVPNSKGAFKSAAVGFAAGAVVATIGVWGFVFFDSVVRSKKKIEDNLNVSVLGVIPVFEKCNKSEKGV